MFTGIIEEMGTLLTTQSRQGGHLLDIICTKVKQDTFPGASMAVNGVCLTAAELTKKGFRAFAVEETLKCSNLGTLAIGGLVNLERPVTLAQRLGGHLVSGHIDGLAVLKDLKHLGEGAEYHFDLPQNLLSYVIHKGSIALNGVSLTVAEIDGTLIKVALIPETLRTTTLGRAQIGDRINVEVDQIAKYVENFVGTKSKQK